MNQSINQSIGPPYPIQPPTLPSFLPVDDILQDLVKSMAYVKVSIRIRGSVMKGELLSYTSIG